jgi:hypothetical protein
MVHCKEGKGVQKKRKNGVKRIKGIDEWVNRGERNVLIHSRGEKKVMR